MVSGWEHVCLGAWLTVLSLVEFLLGLWSSSRSIRKQAAFHSPTTTPFTFFFFKGGITGVIVSFLVKILSVVEILSAVEV